jgi:hypothetical protein
MHAAFCHVSAQKLPYGSQALNLKRRKLRSRREADRKGLRCKKEEKKGMERTGRKGGRRREIEGIREGLRHGSSIELDPCRSTLSYQLSAKTQYARECQPCVPYHSKVTLKFPTMQH